MIYDNIDKLIKSNSDELLVFCVANYPVIKFVENLLISAEKIGINVVVFCLDETITQELNNKMDVELVRHKSLNFIDSNKCSEFGSRNFGNIVFERFFISKYLLKNGRSIVYTDVDVVFCRDFREDIKNHLLENDFVCQTEWLPRRKKQNRGCTGFFAMKPSPNLIKFFEEKSMKKKKYQKYNTNQKFINRYFNGFQVNPICTTKLLLKEDYPNGICYKRMSQVRKECYIIHFNCEVGIEKKMNFMKKYKKYFLKDIN